MMMRMLEAGGMPVMTDRVRAADDDNPRGYYEFEAVKRTRQDGSWLETAGAKAVKMVYRLVYDLPATYRYRVIFMRRNMDELLASQKKMLRRQGKAGDSISDEQMAVLFRSELQKFEAWVARQPNFSMIQMDYNRLLEDPTPLAEQINHFLGGNLDTESMVGVIEPALYRNRCT